MALLGELALQWRERLLDLCQGRLLRHHVRLGNLAGTELGAQENKHIRSDLDELLGRLDLAAQRGLLHRRNHDIRRQSQVGGLQLKTLVVRLGLKRLDIAPDAAEDIGRIRNQNLAGKEIEGRIFRKHQIAIVVRHSRPTEGGLLARRREVAVDGRQECALAGGDICLGDTQRRLGGGQIGIVPQCAFDQAPERPRPEQSPPVSRDVTALGKSLRRSRCDIRGCGPCRRAPGRVAADVRRRRRREVGSHGASADEGGREDRRNAARWDLRCAGSPSFPPMPIELTRHTKCVVESYATPR